MNPLFDEAPIDYSTQSLLIVDDSPTSRMLLRAYFEQAGFTQIDEAVDGLQALEKIELKAPDLVLVDVHMPRMDGLELCHTLHERGLHHHIAMIMMSQSMDMRLRSQAFELGVMDFITKPLYETEVISRTLAHLERHLLSRNMQMHYRHLQQEVHDAMKLQRFLLPSDALLQTIHQRSKIEIAYHHQAASSLAGDYISVRLLPNQKTILALADVSGHGIAAALYSFSIHALLNQAIVRTDDPAEILRILNEQLVTFMTETSFATMVVVVVDRGNHRLTYASAASPKPLLMRSKGSPIALDSTGTVLGMFEDAQYRSISIDFNPEDVLFLYSDALVESIRAQGTMLEEEDLYDVLHKERIWPCSHIITSVLEQFTHTQLAHLHDDLTLLACKLG
jgi:phosphoserine phosphatase RsbU/P